VNLPAPTGRKPFYEERAKRLQRKARPAGKRPEITENQNLALGIKVNLPAPTGRKPFCEEREKRLQRKARPAGKCPKIAKVTQLSFEFGD